MIFGIVPDVFGIILSWRRDRSLVFVLRIVYDLFVVFVYVESVSSDILITCRLAGVRLPLDQIKTAQLELDRVHSREIE